MAAHGLSSDEFDEIKADFDALDADGSGAVDAAEVRTLLAKERGGAQPSEAEVAAMMGQFDLDASGTVTLAEYVQALCAPPPPLSPPPPPPPPMDEATSNALNAVFTLLDEDGSDHIEEMEGLAIGKALGCINPAAYWADLAKMDADGDGKVSRDEYLRGMHGIELSRAQLLREELSIKLAARAVQGARAPPPKPKLPSTASKAEIMAAHGLSSDEFDEIKADFDALDADGSGAVDAAEVRTLLAKERGGAQPSEAEVAAMMGQFDLDASGTVAFVEYVTVLMT